MGPNLSHLGLPSACMTAMKAMLPKIKLVNKQLIFQSAIYIQEANDISSVSWEKQWHSGHGFEP